VKFLGFLRPFRKKWNYSVKNFEILVYSHLFSLILDFKGVNIHEYSRFLSVSQRGVLMVYKLGFV